MANNRNRTRSGRVKAIKVAQRRKRRLQIIAIVLLIVLLLLLALSSFHGTTVSTMKDGSKSFFSNIGPGGGYPYAVNSNAVADVGVLDGDIFLLENNQTVTLNSTAKEIKRDRHTYGRPAMDICSNRALVYDRGGNRYRIETRKKIIKTGKLHADESIITGAIGKKGNIAFGTLTSTASSRLVVINRNYKKRVFVWDCADYTVTSVALSDNGKYAAVSVIGSENAEEYSKVFVFDFDYSEPLCEKEYLGTSIIKVHFSDNNDVVAVGDNACIFLRNFNDSKTVKYGESTLNGFAFANNGATVLCISDYGSLNAQRLVGYRPNGKEAFRKTTDRQVKGIWSSDSRIAVLTINRVELYTFGGHLTKAVGADVSARKALLVGNRVYIYKNGSIVKGHHVSKNHARSPS